MDVENVSNLWALGALEPKKVKVARSYNLAIFSQAGLTKHQHIAYVAVQSKKFVVQTPFGVSAVVG